MKAFFTLKTLKIARPREILALGMLLYLLCGCIVEGNTLDSEGWDVDALDTARNVTYLTRVEKDVILELNKVRANPGKYAELYIRPRLAWFDGSIGGKGYRAPGQTVIMRTVEGQDGVLDCIADLAGREAMPPLASREGLFKAAKDHVLDTGPKGITGHTGSDSSTMSGRMNRYGQWGGSAGENISYGEGSGRDIIIQLLIDDGVANRGHRTNNLNKNFGCIGVSIGSHSRYETMCVLDFSNQYASTNNMAEQEEEQKRASNIVQSRSDADARNWDVSRLDMAKDMSFLTGIEKDVMLEFNKVRSDPQKYARLYLAPSSAGYTAIMAGSPLPLLTFERGLYLASKDENGGLGEKVRRYGSLRGGGVLSASIFGGFENGRAVVVYFLNSYSDYVLDAGSNYVGFSVRANAQYGLRCDFIFVGGYVSNP
ncbi:MAG: CAP domain-containing protein [Treponema sp.]|jgi:hypothetical protein|nr:CAP domain-containing protein [Treponema sp.]